MINKALKLIRQFHKSTQADLATKFGMSKSYLSEIESGKKPVSLDLLNKYSSQFDIPVSSLIFFSETLNSKKPMSGSIKKAMSAKLLELMEWFIKRDDSNGSQIKN